MRKNGHYWVKYNKDSKPEPAEWNDKHWQFLGVIGYYEDDELAEIDERRIIRKK